mgnify:CR=1 FL=1
MQLFYAPDIMPPLHTLGEEESKHCIRVLRLQCGGRIHITDGRGNLFCCEITDDNPKRCTVRVVSTEEGFEKMPYALTVAVAPTKNPDRFEWLLEKATEVGVTEFLPKDPLWLAATCVVLADAVMSFFGSMGNDGAFNPWTTDISSAGNRGKVGGALAVMPVFATIFGAIVSGIIIDALDFFAFFTIMGGMVIAVGVLCLFTLRDAPGLAPNRDPRGFWHQFAAVFDYKIVGRNRELFWVFLVMMVYFIGFNVYFPYITVYFTDNLGMDYTLTGVVQGAGLLAASVLTIPAARFIDRGKCGPVIAAAVGCNLLGLLGVSFSTAFVPLLIGVFGAGAGYILVLQALTAWIKNLYPEDQRGQFEGVKQLFFVCVPMIVGPAIATPVINAFGVEKIVNGGAGMVPGTSLFLISGLVTLLALLPLFPAARMEKARAGAAAQP